MARKVSTLPGDPLARPAGFRQAKVQARLRLLRVPLGLLGFRQWGWGSASRIVR